MLLRGTLPVLPSQTLLYVHPCAAAHRRVCLLYCTGRAQADEEILLLEAIDIYGPGNWAAIAEHVGGKTPAACKVRRMRVRARSPCSSLRTRASFAFLEEGTPYVYPSI